MRLLFPRASELAIERQADFGATSQAKTISSIALGTPRTIRWSGSAASATTLPKSRGAMKARRRAVVSASCCADGVQQRLNIIA
jgi:hypothetical protein